MATTSTAKSEWTLTHLIKHDGETVEVCLVDGAAYTRAEWDAFDRADYERSESGVWTFQGRTFRGSVKRVKA